MFTCILCFEIIKYTTKFIFLPPCAGHVLVMCWSCAGCPTIYRIIIKPRTKIPKSFFIFSILWLLVLKKMKLQALHNQFLNYYRIRLVLYIRLFPNCHSLKIHQKSK